jgi:hypothetical protein
MIANLAFRLLHDVQRLVSDAMAIHVCYGCDLLPMVEVQDLL